MAVLTKQKKIDILVSCLNDQNEAVKLHALDLLVRSNFLGITRHLVRLTEDKDVAVRSRVALALGNSNDKFVSTYLIKLLDDNDEGVRESAFNALTRLKPDNMIAIVKKAIQDSSLAIQKKAIDVVKENSIIDLINDVVTLILLSSSKEAITKANDVVLFLSRSNPNVPFLNVLLSYDPNKSVYKKAYSVIDKYAVSSNSDLGGFSVSTTDTQDIESARERYYSTLRKVGNSAIISNIINALTSSENTFIKANAVKAIGEIEHKESVEIVVKALLKESDKMFRRQAVKTLGIIGNSSVVDVLLEVMSKDENVLWEASEALGRLGDFRAVNPLVELLLHNENDNIRKTAALALCNFKDNRVIKPLVMAFINDSFVRPYLSLSFRQFGDHRIVEFLIGLLHQDNEDIKYHAVIALGDMESSYAIYSLVELINDDSERVREAALDSLGKINNVSIFEDILIISVVSEEEKIIEKAHKIIMRIASDSNLNDRIVNLFRNTNSQKPMRERVLETLRNAGGDKFVGILNKKLSSPNLTEKCNAIKILGSFGDEGVSGSLIKIIEDKSENERVREAALDSLILGNLGETFM